MKARSYTSAGSYRNRHTRTELKTNFVAQHFIKLEDGGFECKYCDVQYKARKREEMMLHLIHQHKVGVSSTLRG